MAPWLCSQVIKSQKLSQEVSEADTRADATWSSGCICWGEVIGWQSTGTCLLDQSHIQGWLCSWHSFLHCLHAASSLMLGQGWGGMLAKGKLLSAAWSWFLPVVCESSSSGEHGLMPSTKSDFQQGCGTGMHSWLLDRRPGRRVGRRSGWSGRWNLAQGGCQVPSSICLFPFNFLLSRADQLEL